MHLTILKQQDLIQDVLKKDYQYEEFYFAELIKFFDIGNQVIQLLSRMDKNFKNAEARDNYLGRAYL